MGEIKGRREDWGMEFRKYRFVIFGWGSTAENEKQLNLKIIDVEIKIYSSLWGLRLVKHVLTRWMVLPFPELLCEYILKCFKDIELYSTGESKAKLTLKFQTYDYHSLL